MATTVRLGDGAAGAPGSFSISARICTTSTAHKCAGCGAVFAQPNKARRHRDTSCPGAEVHAIKCDRLVEIDEKIIAAAQKVKYYEAEAMRLANTLRQGADAVRKDPGAAGHLKEWAADALKMLAGGTPLTYGERLFKYRRCDVGFYKLPQASREDVAAAVENIEREDGKADVEIIERLFHLFERRPRT